MEVWKSGCRSPDTDNNYEAYVITYHPKEQKEYYITPKVKRIALKKTNGGRWKTIYHRYQI